jgi:hypothetical protein
MNPALDKMIAKTKQTASLAAAPSVPAPALPVAVTPQPEVK